jgi:predicted ATP-grasp superfamily ATP-dependent carboligase
MRAGPRVLVLDGDYPTSLTIARELSTDLDATIIGAGTARYSRLCRSTYCDVAVTVPPTGDPGYLEALWAVIDAHRPQVLLPVGYESASALQSVRDDLPRCVAVPLPDPDAFEAAADKRTTMERAAGLGIDVPDDYSRLVREADAAGRPPGTLDALEFPVFCKARREAGGGHATTARVDEPARFWRVYDRLRVVAPTAEVLVQECIDGSASTYGCGLRFENGEVALRMCHEERRSVPRRGGSATRIRLRRDPDLAFAASELLRDLDWHGVALVEFKRRESGELVCMEVNPKFWASYALASRYGYRFASQVVAAALDLDERLEPRSPAQQGEMVFPLRELYHYARNRGNEDERLLDSLRTIAKPGAAWNVDRADLGAWLTPPIGLIEKLPVARADPTRSAEREPAAFSRR